MSIAARTATEVDHRRLRGWRHLRGLRGDRGEVRGSRRPGCRVRAPQRTDDRQLRRRQVNRLSAELELAAMLPVTARRSSSCSMDGSRGGNNVRRKLARSVTDRNADRSELGDRVGDRDIPARTKCRRPGLIFPPVGGAVGRAASSAGRAHKRHRRGRRGTGGSIVLIGQACMTAPTAHRSDPRPRPGERPGGGGGGGGGGKKKKKKKCEPLRTLRLPGLIIRRSPRTSSCRSHDRGRAAGQYDGRDARADRTGLIRGGCMPSPTPPPRLPARRTALANVAMHVAAARCARPTPTRAWTMSTP
jgi:hypothetical protein